MGKIIGIDLGTTNSCVAVLEGNEPVVITNSEGKRTTPSIVAFVEGGERKVGDPAKRQAITNPQKTVFSIKRFMGETFDQVQKEINRIPYKVVRGDNNTPRVDIDGRLYTPQEISAMILQKMKKTAEDYLGQEVTEAVITVPAYFKSSRPARRVVRLFSPAFGPRAGASSPGPRCADSEARPPPGAASGSPSGVPGPDAAGPRPAPGPVSPGPGPAARRSFGR